MALLTQAVYNLVKLYLRSFCPPSASFRSPSSSEAVEGRSSKEASGTTDHLQFTLFALHGIPESWVSRSDVFSCVISDPVRHFQAVSRFIAPGVMMHRG